MKFNENLKYLRKKENLTQEQLAEKLNVSRQAVTKWEGGQALPDITNLKDIAILFGVTTDELLGDEKSTNSNTLDKRLKELPWQLLLITLTVINIIGELGINNIEMVFLILVLIIPLEAIYIKWFLTNRKIIDLTNTEEGKKARRKRIFKDARTIGIIGGIIEIVIYIARKMQGLETQSITELISVIIIYFVTALVCDYLILKSKVKKYNK